MTAHNSCLKNHQTCLKPWHTIFPAWLAWSTMDTRVWAAHINWSRSRISIATAIPTRGAILVWSWPRRSTIADNTACNIGALNDNLVMMFCQLNVVRWPGLVSRKMEHFSERVVHKLSSRDASLLQWWHAWVLEVTKLSYQRYLQLHWQVQWQQACILMPPSGWYPCSHSQPQPASYTSHELNWTKSPAHAQSHRKYNIPLQLEMALLGWPNVPRTACLECQEQPISRSLETKPSSKRAAHGSMSSSLAQRKALDGYFPTLDALKAAENADWSFLSSLDEQTALASLLSVPTFGC